MRELRSSPRVPGQHRIYTAGEKEYYNEQNALENGVEIAPGVQKVLKTLSQDLNLSWNDLAI